jgi:hypothetical protein
MGEITDNWSLIHTRMSAPAYTSFDINTSTAASILQSGEAVRAPVNKIVKETSYPGASKQQLHPFADRAIHQPNLRQPSQGKGGAPMYYL